MTARILKIANSAMYSCSRKVKTLTEAIVMLGFNSIRSLVVTSAARNLYNTKSSQTGLKERLLWEHSIGAAFACRLLVEPRLPGLTEEAFLAGLMHDIGKLVLNLRVPAEFDEIVQVVYNENREFSPTERELLGFDHAHVGAMLVNKWKFSPTLEDVILNHHNAEALTRGRAAAAVPGPGQQALPQAGHRVHRRPRAGHRALPGEPSCWDCRPRPSRRRRAVCRKPWPTRWKSSSEGAEMTATAEQDRGPGDGGDDRRHRRAAVDPGDADRDPAG